MNIIKKIAKKNERKNENRLPMPDKVKRGYRYYCSLVAAVALMGCCTMTAFAAPAAGGDPLTVIPLTPSWSVGGPLPKSRPQSGPSINGRSKTGPANPTSRRR